MIVILVSIRDINFLAQKMLTNTSILSQLDKHDDNLVSNYIVTIMS